SQGHYAVNGADYPTKLPNRGRRCLPRYPPRPEGRGLPRNLIKPHLRGSGCKPYINDMKVRIGTDDAYYYPDLLVSCDPADHKRNYSKQSPLLIIEILSSSTEAYDRGGKFAFYRQLTSLQEYVLIDPRTYRVDVFRRTPQNRWELFNFEGADAEVEFASINFHCPMQAIYEDVDFELV
ncbi:MAG: Uma2 family endonuclease, partial [Thiothrix litoralis]|uniref:Uma2 family endonuclease n=1 Tax=Thiothrix litoralis TaxID=2891210 RepID=UPI003C789323